MRGKRNFTRTAVHAAPRPFLFIALGVSGSVRLTTHLVGYITYVSGSFTYRQQDDQFFISHKHQADDGLPNLEESHDKEPVSEDDASTSSVVRSSPYMFEKRKPSLMFSQEVLILDMSVNMQTNSSQEISKLTALAAEVRISSEVRAYLHNIVVFMRLHRAVAGGISAMATRHFNTLSQ